MKLSVIIPCFNEKQTIKEIINRVNKVDIDKEIIIVDDGSYDGTVEILKEIKDDNIKIIYHKENKGKGAAIRTAVEYVTGDIVIIQDADLEYNPEEYHILIQPIIDKKADVVYGSRFTGSPRRVLFFWHTLGNNLLTFLSNVFTNLNLTDMTTGYKVFRTEVIKRIKIRANRFEFEPEVTAKVAKMRYRIYEVPISYSGRDYFEGKKITWKDGIKIILTIIKYAFVDDEENEVLPYRILNKMRRVKRYNQWIYEKIKPYLGNRVLEVGSGIGNITRYLLDRDIVIATDIEEKYLTFLKNNLSNNLNIKIEYFDVTKNNNSLHKYNIDTIICLNVLEHIEDDITALKNLYEVLRENGKLILLLPALKFLYGELDKGLGHYRRYNKEDIIQKLEVANFKILTVRYFNFLGAIGWFLNSRILKQRVFSTSQLKLYDILIPLLKIENYFKLPIGMGLIAVGEKVC